VINYAISKGCIVVAAAGNNGIESILYPAAFPGVVSVAATNSSDAKAGFSNYGSAITISAPGDGIYSTLVGGGYGYMSGTSMASPLVAGLLASMHAYNPWMPNSDLVNCLKSSATNIDASNAAYLGKLGAGRINAAAAMQCVGSYLQTPPTVGFSASNTIVAAGATVLFRNLSTYATSWSWSFEGGTPTTSTEKEPEVKFNTPGAYKVTLTAANDYGSKKETKANYIIVNTGTSCLMANYPVPTTWIADAMTTGGGWVNGTNAYKDLQKAMYFDASTTAATFMTRVLVKFAYANTQDVSKKINLRIYDGTSGIPAKLLRTESLTMSNIMDDVIHDRYTTVIFKQPVALPVSKKYFVSVDVSNLYGTTSTDPIVIWSNQNGQTIPNATWEQWSDGTWHAYESLECWGLNMSLYIHPFLTNEPTLATFKSSATTICADGTVSLDATGSTDPANLEWSFESGNPVSATNVLTQSVIFSTSGPHQVKLTVSGGGCNEIRDSTTIINVNENVTPSLTLTSNTDAPDMPVTFTAVPAYGGQVPVFTFKKNGDIVQSGSARNWNSGALRSGDLVSCTMQSNYSCVTTATANSNSITISENTMSITVLPVQLIYFKGSSVTGANLLQWASATESNTDKYIVEYSTDRTRFSATGTVRAKGESNTTEAYQFQDTRTTPAYYRLRMVDKDGSFKFSQVIYLGGNKSSGMMLWPNPAVVGQEVQLALTVANAKQQIVQILDAFGKVLNKSVVPVRNGKLETAIPTQNLFPGIYFISITDQLTGNVQKEKLVIVK
jgi:PKD repeat protein